MSGWTEEIVDRIKQMWAAGRSARQIAEELDCGLTRSAVIGKLHRLGLTRSYSPGVARRAQTPTLREDAAPRQRLRRLSNRGTRLEWREVFAPVALPPSSAETNAGSRGKTLMELCDWHCRWPIGDPCNPGFVFCGDERLAGSSYCAHHARMACSSPADTEEPRAA
jgi:GcrA cell cycle regulator